jgi:hypothetical protein
MNELIRQWLILVLGYDDQHVIEANQEGPIPIGPFATYQILSVIPSKHSIEDPADKGVDDDIIVTYYNRGEVTVQVDVYSETGWIKQHNLSQSGYLLAVRKIFQSSYVSLINSTLVQNLTALVDTKHKARYQCDHTFFVWNTVIEENQKVGGYTSTGKYHPGDEVVVIDAT